ncbi:MULTISPECIES: hypothetical protein [Chryseobacterium]|nr:MULTISPECIES: hypothetical protein [Chryseobacterium]
MELRLEVVGNNTNLFNFSETGRILTGHFILNYFYRSVLNGNELKDE